MKLRWVGFSKLGSLGNMVVQDGSKVGARSLINMYIPYINTNSLRVENQITFSTFLNYFLYCNYNIIISIIIGNILSFYHSKINT